ncbi:GNAT family N-acetyltransferase [Cryptosporangium sp. NPDC048952]|uniref:GNAT family N-acetyltransferase n=1 Tax=Cryptosporangium sp. NPDC048952 TaxID=3363961 RepID=UPI003716957C
MSALERPSPHVRTSYLVAMAEFADEGRGLESDRTSLGEEIRRFGPEWSSLDGFTRYVVWLNGLAREDTPRREGFVPATTFWWVDGDTYLGRLAIRHRLTPDLLEAGGHIGYDIRPSARRQGHATAMLRAALPAAHALGINPALITCDTDNIASRRVIEQNAGTFDDQRGDTLRFWVPTT